MKRVRIAENIPLHTEKSLFTLVENRSAYTLDRCELNVYETHREAKDVKLVFGDMVLTSMLRGKKVMRLFDRPAFDYLPGESVIVPPNEIMNIDFPEANHNQPTQCIALAINHEQIFDTLNLLNDRFPKVESDEYWQIDNNRFHLTNSTDLSDSIQRMIRISVNEHTKEKDVLAGLTLRELLVRLMQTQARQLFEMNYVQMATRHRFAHVIQYIKENLTGKIDMDVLSEKACMSRANFFRKFKENFGHTPAEYVLQQRIKMARELLKSPKYQVTQVCFSVGFNNLNHFIRCFKNYEGITPKQYQDDFKTTL
jgi:AraC family transcriptional regulator